MAMQAIPEDRKTERERERKAGKDNEAFQTNIVLMISADRRWYAT